MSPSFLLLLALLALPARSRREQVPGGAQPGPAERNAPALSSSSSAARPSRFPRSRPGRRRGRLYCRVGIGFHLQLHPDGRVDGAHDASLLSECPGEGGRGASGRAPARGAAGHFPGVATGLWHLHAREVVLRVPLWGDRAPRSLLPSLGVSWGRGSLGKSELQCCLLWEGGGCWTCGVLCPTAFGWATTLGSSVSSALLTLGSATLWGLSTFRK